MNWTSIMAWLSNFFTNAAKDWKTTVLGICMLFALWLYGNGTVSTEELLVIVTALGGLGLAVSSDSKKKNGTDTNGE